MAQGLLFPSCLANTNNNYVFNNRKDTKMIRSNLLSLQESIQIQGVWKRAHTEHELKETQANSYWEKTV